MLCFMVKSIADDFRDIAANIPLNYLSSEKLRATFKSTSCCLPSTWMTGRKWTGQAWDFQGNFSRCPQDHHGTGVGCDDLLTLPPNYSLLRSLHSDPLGSRLGWWRQLCGSPAPVTALRIEAPDQREPWENPGVVAAEVQWL